MTWMVLALLGCQGSDGVVSDGEEADVDTDADTDADADADTDVDTDADTEVDTGTLDTGGPTAGPVVFTELMVEPVSGTADWVELQNASNVAVDLDQYTLRVETPPGVQFHDLTGTLGPGDLFLLARSDEGGMLPADQIRPSLDFPSDFALLRVIGPAGVDDQLFYDRTFSTGDSMPVGASISLEPTVDPLSDIPENWCDGWSAFGAGDFGTPGEPNESCGKSVEFEYTYTHASDASQNIQGSEIFSIQPTIRVVHAGGGVMASYLRQTTMQGQWFEFTFPSLAGATGVTYEAMRPFGSDCFDGGEIVDLPAGSGYVQGSWTVTACN